MSKPRSWAASWRCPTDFVLTKDLSHWPHTTPKPGKRASVAQELSLYTNFNKFRLKQPRFTSGCPTGQPLGTPRLGGRRRVQSWACKGLGTALGAAEQESRAPERLEPLVWKRPPRESTGWNRPKKLNRKRRLRSVENTETDKKDLWRKLRGQVHE